MAKREYETSYITPISDYEEQLRNNGYAVVEVQEVYE
jgi:hypothetical protein